LIAAELGLRDLGDLVTVGGHSKLADMMTGVTERVGDQASREYGVEVVAVRLRRLNYPEEVRSAVFEQIRSERQRVAAATRAEGESQARIIRSAADRQRAATIAAAEADAARTIGEGEAKAARIANEAQAADPAFFQFLKTLETYRAALDSKTTLVLSADSSFLQLLTRGVPDPAVSKPRQPASSPGDPVAAKATQPAGTSPHAMNGSAARNARAASKAVEGRQP
jgi:membrane protease subunit HflC